MKFDIPTGGSSQDSTPRLLSNPPDPQAVTEHSLRCPFCGTPNFKQEQIHGHYLCVACRMVITGCCDGER